MKLSESQCDKRHQFHNKRKHVRYTCPRKTFLFFVVFIDFVLNIEFNKQIGWLGGEVTLTALASHTSSHCWTSGCSFFGCSSWMRVGPNGYKSVIRIKLKRKKIIIIYRLLCEQRRYTIYLCVAHEYTHKLHGVCGWWLVWNIHTHTRFCENYIIYLLL